MDLSDRLTRNTGNKLLTFRSPAPPVHGLDASPDLTPNVTLVPHDIAMLRRPVPVESVGAPRLQEMDGLAHDARNLITSLSLVSGLLGQPGVLSNEHRHYAGDLETVASSLGVLIERMAAAGGGPRPAGSAPVFVREPLRGRLTPPPVNRAEAGTLPTDAGSTVKSCEQLLAAIAGPAVNLHISFERGLGPLALGGEDLTRVLINLVKNASEAMPDGGRVAITVRKALGAGPAALITVQDTGAGIPAHAMGQIFQAGFSSKKPGRRWPATTHYGLGLTIVRDLVESAGGSVRVSSTLRKGTTFELKVPCGKG